MQQPDDKTRIRHMIEAAETIENMVTGKQRADLDADRVLTFALAHAVMIIGEAASKTSESTRQMIPSLPWPNIVSMRNRLVHAYYDVDRNILWKTATVEVPQLLADLRGIIDLL